MGWLKEHVYLAAWIALPVMVLVAFVQNKKVDTKAGSFPLTKVLAYGMLLICFPMSLSPFIAGGTRAFAATLAVGLLIAIFAGPESLWQKQR